MGVSLDPFSGQLILTPSVIASGVLDYKGTWDPTTNTPTLVDGTGTTGWVYYVSAAFAGPIAGLSNPSMVNFQIGDLVIYNGSQWELASPKNGVVSVNGAQGVVTVNAINQLTSDVTAGPASGSQSKAATVAAIQGTTISGTTGSGNVVFSASPTLTGTVNTAAVNVSGLTASEAVFTDSSKNLVSNAITGTGNVVMSASPTLTGTITAAAANLSGTVNISGLTASELVATDSSKNLVSQVTGNLTDAGTDGITVTNGTGAVIGTGTSLSQHVADTTHNGYLASADWNTFNGKQAAGNYITALTGDVTATGPGSVSASVAKIQGTTVSGTTGSTNVVFSTGPTLSNPIVGTQAQLDGSTKAASTSYVDTAVANAIAGVNPAVAVQAATTAANDTSGFTYTHVAGVGDFFTGSVNTAVTIDGFTFTALGQRLLVKNDTQSPSGAFNGIYYVTQLQTGILPPVFTRALDYDTPSDINNTGAIPVVNGTVNGTTSWVQTAQIVTVGTTPLVFVKFTRNPADYLLVANNLSDVASKSTSFNNLSPMTTSGDIIYGGASGTGTRLGANSTATNKYLQSVSSGTPTWQQVAMADLSGTATVTQGGTGISNPTTHNLLIGAGSSALTQLAPVAGTVLAATSASADPSFSATPTLGVNGTTTGQLLLATSAGSGQSITIQNRASTTAYNFNLPNTAGSSGQFLTSQGGGSSDMTWSNSPGTTNTTYNYLVNGAFDYWQVGTSATVTATGGATPTNTYLYQADQWYVNNILGGGTIEGVITFSQQSGVTTGSLFGAQAKITTAPTGTGIQNGCEMYQVLSNKASQQLMGQTASFSVLVKGLNNVNQVGVQFYYATSEAKLATAIGSEVLTTVNSSTFTACTISGQALGTSMTSSGVIGVRIRITNVSSGHTYDLNNGFVCEQAILNLGSIAATFQRQYADPVQELAACHYFYEKSYDTNTAPATNTNNGLFFGGWTSAASAAFFTIPFKVSKRAVPSISYWDKVGNATRNTVFATSNSVETDNLTYITSTTPSIWSTIVAWTNNAGAGENLAIHWVADARI